MNGIGDISYVRSVRVKTISNSSLFIILMEISESRSGRYGAENYFYSPVNI